MYLRNISSGQYCNSPGILFTYSMHPGLDIYTGNSYTVQKVKWTENRKYIKGLIPSKNKPQTGIWTSIDVPYYGTMYLVPGTSTRYLLPGTNLAPGTWYLVSGAGTWYLVLVPGTGTRYHIWSEGLAYLIHGPY